MEKIITERKDKRIYVDGDKCYKVFRAGYNKADILNEALNHARVEETGLHIPPMQEVKMIGDQWAIVTTYIEGNTLDELLEKNPDREDEYLEKFVDIQIDMQGRKCPLLNKHRDKMNRKISQTDLSATLRYDLHNRIEAMPRYNNLCHGDYNPSNVIIDEKGSARTFLLFLLENKKERARKYLDLFCEKSGCSRKSILEWLPILAASQSVKGRKNESAFLHRLIFMDEEELENLYEQ